MSADAASSGGRSGATEVMLHAACVGLDEAGILIRGEPGSGKSRLALELLHRAAAGGRRAGLVGDDRVRIARCLDGLVARPHPAIAGLIEIRGLGILRVAQPIEAAPLRLVVDLVENGLRLPEPAAGSCEILGVPLPRLTLDRATLDIALEAMLVEDRLAAEDPGVAGLTHRPILAWGGGPNV